MIFPFTTITTVAAVVAAAALTLTAVDGFSQSPLSSTSSSMLSSTRSTSGSKLFMASVAKEKVYIPEPMNEDGFPKQQKSYAEEEEFVFISVEEAEERLRHERMQFEFDHEEMRRLIDEQRHELDELHHRSQEQQLQQRRGSDSFSRSSSTTTRGVRLTESDVIDVTDQTEDVSPSSSSSSSSRNDRAESYVHGKDHRRHGPSHSQPRVHPPHSPQFHHYPSGGVVGGGRKQPFMQPDAAFSTCDSFSVHPTPPMMSYHEAHILDLERRLHQAIEENVMLVEQLQTQRHMFDEEKRELEQRILEEHERVLSLQEELTMERTYFHQSKVELEDMVATERKKVEHLQDELLIREMQDQQRMFQHHQEHYQSQNGGNTRTHYTQQQSNSRRTPVGNGLYVGANGRQQHRQGPQHFNGLEMNMNDIRTPLYP